MVKNGFSLALISLVAGCGKVPPTPTRFFQMDSPDAKNAFQLRLVNEARASGYRCGEEDFPAVRLLVWNNLLEKTAAAHAKDLAENDYFSHTGKDGSQPSDRVDRTGYLWSTVGENIAKGQQSIPEVVTGWLKSPGHCKNIMNAAFTQLGAARDRSTWVQVFGTPR